MALVEREIESKIITALTALNLPDVQITPSWVRVEESSDVSTVLSVSVPARSYFTPQIPTATISPVVSILVRPDLDPDGAVMLNAADKVLGLFQSYQDNLDTAIAAFTTTHFTPAGFRLDGGEAPELDFATGKNSMRVQFQLTGVIS